MKTIIHALQKVVSGLYKVDVSPELTRPDEQFGDYSTNVALQLAGKLNKPPREVSQEILVALKAELKNEVKDVTIAGPGFINLTLSDEALVALAKEAFSSKWATYKGKVVVAEYSDPNPFKVLHAGHLYTTIVGDVVAKLLEGAGAKVHRINYGGDVGLHVGRAMWGIIKHIGGELPEKLKEVPLSERSKWMSKRYVEGNSAYEDNDEAKREIIEVNKRVYKLQESSDRDSPFAQIYWTCRQWSYDGFDELYKQLNITKFEKYLPESQVTPLAMEMVQKGKAEGLFVESEGATVFKGEEHGLHTRVFITKEGLPTYEAKDLGLAATKWQDYHFDLGFIITGNDIVEYMKVVLKALSHFYPEVAERSRHLTHGMIKLPGGQKMSSRIGNVLLADDVLFAARSANKKLTGSINEDTVLAAVKYIFLKQRVGGDIVFDPEESVSQEGNSGPYLQYAHARACSILSNAGKAAGTSSFGELNSQERSLVRKIGEYTEVIEKATSELMPHYVCTYLYELTQTFNRFYEDNRVIGDSREAVRVQLLENYGKVLKDGLTLLGIPAPERV